jgi:hypothetical protein
MYAHWATNPMWGGRQVTEADLEDMTPMADQENLPESVTDRGRPLARNVTGQLLAEAQAAHNAVARAEQAAAHHAPVNHLAATRQRVTSRPVLVLGVAVHAITRPSPRPARTGQPTLAVIHQTDPSGRSPAGRRARTQQTGH